MKILNRYIFKELLSLLGILLLVFTFVISLWRIPFFSEMIFLGVPIFQVLLLVGYMIPPLLAMSIPPAILASTAMAFSRLSSDSEITAMKASGQSLYRLLVPPLIIGGMALAVMFYLTLFAEPWGVNSFRRAVFKTISSNINLKLKGGTFIEDFDGFVIYTDEIPPDTGVMRGIMITDYRGGKTRRTILAREGRLLWDLEAFKITLRLKDGSIHSPSPEGKKYHLLTFTENDLSLDINKALASSRKKLERKKKSDFTELRDKLTGLSKGDELYLPTLVEYHGMFSTPFAALLFALLGATLGARHRRLGRSGGFVVSVVVAFAYYAMLAAGKGLGDENVIPPALAVWLPNIVLSGYCLLSISRVNREVSRGIGGSIIGLVRARARGRNNPSDKGSAV